MVIGQNLAIQFPFDQHAGRLILVAIGLAIVFFSFWSIEKGEPKWLDRFLAWTTNHFIKNWQLVCLILSLPIVVIVPIAAGTQPKMIHPYLAIFAWFLAIGLVLAATWIRPAPLRWPSKKLVVLTLALITVAFLLRVYLDNRIPAVLTGDEAAAGIAAESFTTGAMNNIFITAWYAFPSFFFTIPAFFIGLLGHTTAALRIPSALAGALTVAATFFFARAMFGKRTAWYAAVFMAVLHFHMNFSRIGLNNIWDGLWYVVTIGSLWYGWEKDRRNAYLLAGLSLGISQYFYSSSRTILIMIFGWVVMAAIFDRARLQRAWVNLFLMLFMTGIVVLPLAWYYLIFPNTFMEPMARVALTPLWLSQTVAGTGMPAWKIILQQVGLAIGSYTYVPLRAWYTPGVPLLRPFAAGLFLIGILFLFLRKGKWHIIPILLWLAAFMAIGGLSESTPAAQRYVAAAPVCALLVGFGLSESTELLGKAFEKQKYWTTAVSTISIILMAILAVSELNFYFCVYTPNIAMSDAHGNGVVAQSLANYLETQPKDLQVVFFGAPAMGYYSVPSIQYLVPEISGVDINQPWSAADKTGITSHHLLFVFLPNNFDQIQPSLADYPGGKLTSIRAADGDFLYKLYDVRTSP